MDSTLIRWNRSVPFRMLHVVKQLLTIYWTQCLAKLAKMC